MSNVSPPTVNQQLERTVRQYEATVADIVRTLSGSRDSDPFLCPFCKGSLARTPTALPSCNHSSPLGTLGRQNFNAGDCPGHASISTQNSRQLDEVLRTMSPGMRQYVMSLEDGYQRKMKEAGTDEKAALQNLQQHMLNTMANNSPNNPHPATSTMGDSTPRIPSVVPFAGGGQTRANSIRSDPSPRKSGFWGAMRRR